MSAGSIAARLAAMGERAARTAEARTAAALVAAVEAELPGVAAARVDDGVRIEGRGLAARAWGTRATQPDAALRAVVAGVRADRSHSSS